MEYLRKVYVIISKSVKAGAKTVEDCDIFPRMKNKSYWNTMQTAGYSFK